MRRRTNLSRVFPDVSRLHLTPTANSAPRGPRDYVAYLATNPLGLLDAVAAVATQAAAIQAAFQREASRVASTERRARLTELSAAAGRLAGVTGALRLAAAGWTHYRAVRGAPTRTEMVDGLTRAIAAFSSAARRLAGSLTKGEGGAMTEVTTGAPAFVGPSTLQALAPLLAWLEGARDQLQTWRAEVEAGGRDDLPPL